MIYFDNAATSYPKPPEVIKATSDAMSVYGANPGRGGYEMSVATAQKIYDTRLLLNDFFEGFGAEYVSFTPNCTVALNIAIKGIINEGDHAIISSLEHNSVARPLEQLKKDGVADYDVFVVDSDDSVTVENFRKAFKENTKLCVCTGISNVFGDILPLKDLSKIAHENGALFVVDGAQMAGIFPLSMKKLGIDCLCVPGHKGLMGPMGSGAIIHKGIDFKTIIEGGTGTNSLSLEQKRGFPEYLESGTLNVPGIIGLYEGVKCVLKKGVFEIAEIEKEICDEIAFGLQKIEGVEIYSNRFERLCGPLVSFNVNSLHSEQLADVFGRNSIAVRGGYQCSCLAHKYRKTWDRGVVRVSPSEKTSKKDINNVLNLTRKIAFSIFI